MRNLKGFNKYFENTKFDILDSSTYVYDDIVSAVSSEFGSIEDGRFETDLYLNTLSDLYNNGGTIYRLVFVNSEKQIDTNNIGNCWTYDVGCFDRFYNNISNGKKPFLITAQITPKQIDIDISIGCFIALPQEGEINILGKPISFEISSYKK